MTLSFDASLLHMKLKEERWSSLLLWFKYQSFPVLSACTHKSQKSLLKEGDLWTCKNPRSQSICNEVKRKRKKSRQVWQNARSIAITDMSGLKAFSSLTKTSSSDKHGLMSERHILDDTCLCVFTFSQSCRWWLGGHRHRLPCSCLLFPIWASRSSQLLPISSSEGIEFVSRMMELSKCSRILWAKCRYFNLFSNHK